MAARLRIGMIAPPYTDLPPRGYGGTEAVCAGLVDGLVDRGHSVTVFGVGRNGTRGHFVRLADEPQFDRMGQLMPEVVHASAVSRALAGRQLDIIHDHTIGGLLMTASRTAPTVSTMHGPMTGEMGRVVACLGPAVHPVAISADQRRRAPHLPWVGTVHNAISVRDHPYVEDKRDYLLFLARATPDKGAHTAIAAARAAQVPLVIAVKCEEPDERAYFEERVRPHLGPGVTSVGEVGGARKLELLSRARAVLFPIEWEEPFGMVLIEALACGTPVIALRRGSVPELITHGVTGLIADDPAELPALIGRIGEIDPAQCRSEAERHFDLARMAAEYEQVYLRVLLEGENSGHGAARGPQRLTWPSAEETAHPALPAS